MGSVAMDDILNLKNITLIKGDIKNIIKTFNDCEFDAIITDPPYGIGFADYDTSSDIFFELEDEFYRILKDNSWFVFWWAVKKIPEIAKFKKFQYRWMIVVEMKGGNRKSIVGNRVYAPIMIFSKGNPKVKAKMLDMLPALELPQFQGLKIQQSDFKPTYIQATLLKMFGGDRVLDPFAGFGSLLLSALLSDFKGEIIGVESDDRRYEVAKIILNEMTLPQSIPDLIKFFEKCQVS